MIIVIMYRLIIIKRSCNYPGLLLLIPVEHKVSLSSLNKMRAKQTNGEQLAVPVREMGSNDDWKKVQINWTTMSLGIGASLGVAPSRVRLLIDDSLRYECFYANESRVPVEQVKRSTCNVCFRESAAATQVDCNKVDLIRSLRCAVYQFESVFNGPIQLRILCNLSRNKNERVKTT